MVKDIIDNIFKSVPYWQDKKLLLQSINPDFYNNKQVLLRLLGITTQMVSSSNEAKRGMWNHHIYNNLMGDDILRNTNPMILKDRDFAQNAIQKYNRTYIYMDKSLKSSKELALLAASKETHFSDSPNKEPILKYMSDQFQQDSEIAVMATTRNIDNLQYAKNLRRNKYFIIDIMNLTSDDTTKRKVLEYIDKDLFQDKKFVSQMGCFDNMCEQFHGDLEYVSHAVLYDISILKKTDMFDEKIIRSALKSKAYKEDKDSVLVDIFRYIERFNYDYDELNDKIKNKRILHQLFWEFGELLSNEFI